VFGVGGEHGPAENLVAHREGGDVVGDGVDDTSELVS